MRQQTRSKRVRKKSRGKPFEMGFPPSVLTACIHRFSLEDSVNLELPLPKLFGMRGLAGCRAAPQKYSYNPRTRTAVS